MFNITDLFVTFHYFHGEGYCISDSGEDIEGSMKDFGGLTLGLPDQSHNLPSPDKSPNRIGLEHFSFIKVLGKGSFGKVIILFDFYEYILVFLLNQKKVQKRNPILKELSIGICRCCLLRRKERMRFMQ